MYCLYVFTFFGISEVFVGTQLADYLYYFQQIILHPPLLPNARF
jgi:hypothetical protein